MAVTFLGISHPVYHPEGSEERKGTEKSKALPTQRAKRHYDSAALAEDLNYLQHESTVAILQVIV